jgi:hypothetical protein
MEPCLVPSLMPLEPRMMPLVDRMPRARARPHAAVVERWAHLRRLHHRHGSLLMMMRRLMRLMLLMVLVLLVLLVLHALPSRRSAHARRPQ